MPFVSLLFFKEVNMCESCKFREFDHECKQCSTCIHYDFDGFLEFKNYEIDLERNK